MNNLNQSYEQETTAGKQKEIPNVHLINTEFDRHELTLGVRLTGC